MTDGTARAVGRGVGGVLAVVLLAACGPGGTAAAPTGAQDDAVVVSLGDLGEFRVEVADDPEERASGLAGRTEVPAGTGMLFVFDEPQRVSFWMADTAVPLDVAWLSGDVVVGVTSMAPCLSEPAEDCPRYPSPDPVDAALEVPAGALADVVLGTRVSRDGG